MQTDIQEFSYKYLCSCNAGCHRTSVLHPEVIKTAVLACTIEFCSLASSFNEHVEISSTSILDIPRYCSLSEDSPATTVDVVVHNCLSQVMT